MTSQEIKQLCQEQLAPTLTANGDALRALWEIAYHLAIMNESYACSPVALHVCPNCRYSRPYTEWPAAMQCPSCPVFSMEARK